MSDQEGKKPRYRGNLSKMVGADDFKEVGDIALWDNDAEKNQPIMTGNLKKITDGTKKKLLVSLWENDKDSENQPDFTGTLQNKDYDQRGKIALWINTDKDNENKPDVTGTVTIYKGEEEEDYNASLWTTED